MKLISYIPKSKEALLRTNHIDEARGDARLGILEDESVIDVWSASNATLPRDIIQFLQMGEEAFTKAKELPKSGLKRLSLDDITLLAPIPRPTSMRDGYAFRQHVEAARRNRGVEMIPEFDKFPVFYFTNHQAVIGPGPLEVLPEHLKHLDYELEAAIVIGKKGRNIPA